MSAGKGDSPRRVDGDRYRRNFDQIFGRFTNEQPAKGEVIDGHEYLGNGGWHTVDQYEPELRDEKE